MFYIISYDISDDRRRNRIAKLLEGYADRVQYSVFEAELDNPDLNKLIYKAKREMNEKEDSLRIYRLCKDCKKEVKIIGLGVLSDIDFVFIV